MGLLRSLTHKGNAEEDDLEAVRMESEHTVLKWGKEKKKRIKVGRRRSGMAILRKR